MSTIAYYRHHLMLLLFSAFVGLFSAFAQAHDAFASDVRAQLQQGGQLEVELKFASVTVEGFTQSLSDRDNQVSEANLFNIEAHLIHQAKSFFVVTSNNRKLEPTDIAVVIKDNDDAVFFTLHYTGVEVGTLAILSEFITRTNPEFTATLTILDTNGVQLGLFIQSQSHLFDEVQVASTAAKVANSEGVFTGFLVQGLVHIVTGFDHLLFLFALLIVCRDWRSTITIVTCFTLAHSVTLSLASLDIISLPARVVEIVIALTIVYVGVENLVTRHKPKFRWVLTSSFGLIHGFGFASVLRDIGLGSDGAPIVIPLFAFNLGVEAGQIAIVTLCLPLLWQLRKLKVFETYGLPTASVFVSAMGVFWLVVRGFSL